MGRALPAGVVLAAFAVFPGPDPARGGHLIATSDAGRTRIVSLVPPAGAGAPVTPQEGHPLSGTWAGDWGPPDGPRTHLTIVMSWDGKAVTGLINPGPDAIRLTRVRVNWADWTIVIEAETRDAAGQPVAIRADGRLEDIGSSRRRIAGTWSQGASGGDFAVRRE